ncbi:MAG TPA: MarR family winged helix-turn-helix transcriptional regulator [Desulfomonilia bacterium]|nr:MarR family winged helix-turn-helix transcriptional regulator [Desulfomonilia bacterium]
MQDRRIFYKFNRAQHLLYRKAEKQLLSALGITPIQLGVIFFLMENDGCLQKRLASGLHLNSPAVTGLVTRMEKAGLLRKESSKKDARGVHVFLTDKARGLSMIAFPLLKQFNKQITQGFTESEIDTVLRFFESIIERLSKDAPDA